MYDISYPVYIDESSKIFNIGLNKSNLSDIKVEIKANAISKLKKSSSIQPALK